MQTHSATWHHPSAARGRSSRDDSTEPALLPMPSPNRNTARMRENVYVLAPKRSDSIRVQITSAARAVMPDSAITTWTLVASAARAALAGADSAASYADSAASYGVAFAIASPTSATRTLMATATNVATVTSNTRSR